LPFNSVGVRPCNPFSPLAAHFVWARGRHREFSPVPSLSSVAGPYIPLVRGLRGLISGPARSYAAQLCRWRRPIDCSIDHRRPLHPPRSPLGRRGRLLQAAGSAGASLALHFGLSGYLRWSSARAAVNALHYADAVVAVALAASSVPTWPCRTRSGWRCAVRPLIRAASAVVRDVERRRCRRGPRVRRLPLPHGAGLGGLAGLCSVWGVLAAGSGAAAHSLRADAESAEHKEVCWGCRQRGETLHTGPNSEAPADIDPRGELPHGLGVAWRRTSLAESGSAAVCRRRFLPNRTDQPRRRVN